MTTITAASGSRNQNDDLRVRLARRLRELRKVIDGEIGEILQELAMLEYLECEARCSKCGAAVRS